MNYNLSYQIKDFYNIKGYNVILDSSKNSDYLKITNPADKYGFKLVVRISNHDALTGRSECADIQLITKEMYGDIWRGKYESKYGYDDLDFDISGEFAYESELEREEIVKKVVIDLINSKLDF